MNWSIEKQKRLYELLLCAINSDNVDYILDKLSEIYTMIYDNNVDDTKARKLKEVK